MFLLKQDKVAGQILLKERVLTHHYEGLIPESLWSSSGCDSTSVGRGVHENLNYFSDTLFCCRGATIKSKFESPATAIEQGDKEVNFVRHLMFSSLHHKFCIHDMKPINLVEH